MVARISLLIGVVMLAALAGVPTKPRETPAALSLSHSTSFVVFAADCNANPPMLFGGKTLAEMDRCAAVTVRRLLYDSKAKDAVTVGIKEVKFLKPGEVKDLIFITGTVSGLGEKSITVDVTVERELGNGRRELLATGTFAFVSYDLGARKAVPHGLKMPKE